MMPELKYQILIFLTSFQIAVGYGQDRARFRIVENDRVGYIDRQGKVVIQPAFLNGGDFSEGLAAVRVNGRYGFIDTAGIFVIPVQYDFAEAFRFGYASVYTNGKVKLINKKGATVFENRAYKSIRLISPGKAIATTFKSRYELVDIPTGKLLVKADLIRINEFRDGVSVVLRANKSNRDDSDSRYAVIDTNGRFIVHFGTYSEIRNFVDGYALVESDNYAHPEKSFEGVIDLTGKLLFKRSYNGKSYLFNDFHNGLAIINFKHYWDSDNKEFLKAEKSYEGYIDLKGEIVLNDPVNEYLSDFSEGRVFIKNVEGKYQLYDTRFHLITDETFEWVQKNGFENGVAVVRKKHLWALIDTNGNYLFEPKFEEISAIDHKHRLLVYSTDESGKDLYGIASFKGEKLGEAVIQDFGRNLFQNGLLLANIADRSCYVDTAGMLVWQETPVQEKQFGPLNTEYMLSGYFTALSDEDETDLGGFGKSLNSAEQITKEQPFQAGKLSILVDSNQPEIFQNRYDGLTVYVANCSKDTMRFSAQDSRLDMNVQAKDPDGNWKDIEHLPGSWCGNSYHTLKLYPGEYWSFVTPVYEGDFKTVLRIKLTFLENNPDLKKKKASANEDDYEMMEYAAGKVRIVYSNEYTGSVNPGQFWNKGHYTPRGIMDPYAY